MLNLQHAFSFYSFPFYKVQFYKEVIKIQSGAHDSAIIVIWGERQEKETVKFMFGRLFSKVKKLPQTKTAAYNCRESQFKF